MNRGIFYFVVAVFASNLVFATLLVAFGFWPAVLIATGC